MTMTENEIRSILNETKMSQADIEKHIKEGVYVYAEEEKADFVQNCIACMCDEEEAGKMWENMEKVTHEGKAYRVDFCL